MATFKHISSKNADYGAAEQYLTFEHDEFTMKPTLDENGRLMLREDYRIATLNCGDEDFAVACMRSNLRYGKNQKREDVKSHHYITTTPPKPHSEASLLSAMERAGNGDTDPDAERRGLGTPATRAAVIEKLVKGGFAERKGKQLIPTQNGAALISVLPDMLTSPQLTAEWENNLTQIAKGAAEIGRAHV